MTAEPMPRRSAVDGMLPHGWISAVLLDEVADRTLLELRVRVSEGGTVAEDGTGADTGPAERVLGIELPGPGRAVASANGRLTAVWLGPGWWLLDSPTEVEDEVGLEAPLVHRLRAAGAGLSAVEVSGGFVVLELAGPAARSVLGHACSLDLHPRAFAPGSAARTMLAKAQVVLVQTGDAPTYRVWARRSFARYLVEWLTDAATEYLSVTVPG